MAERLVSVYVPTEFYNEVADYYAKNDVVTNRIIDAQKVALVEELDKLGALDKVNDQIWVAFKPDSDTHPASTSRYVIVTEVFERDENGEVVDGEDEEFELEQVNHNNN